jgi:uncharacterized membrane protein
MVPFVVLTGLFVLLTVLGRVAPALALSWWTSLRLSLAAMFLLTASAHWGKRRPDLIQMVPRVFPRPDVLVTVTGVLEILGAVGLLLTAVAPYAALGLSLLLLAIFPANVRAARNHLTIGGRRVQGLIPRALLQLLFLAATMLVFFEGKH